MCDERLIKQLQSENKQLRLKNELLERCIKDLEARLAIYDNAHTPPSLKRGRDRKKGKNEGDKGTPGQKTGHPGITRPQAKPDKEVDVTADRCPDCGAILGDPFKTERKIVEEIPQPQPAIVTQYNVAHYRCPCCHKEVVATNEDCPREGKFGNNTIAQTALMRFEERLPHRKIQSALKRQYSLNISPAAILDLTRRAADSGGGCRSWKSATGIKWCRYKFS